MTVVQEDSELLLRTVTVLLAVEWVLLLLVEPGVALLAGAVWFSGRFLLPMVER